MPVSDASDVLAAYPVEVRREAVAPVRDALVAGQTAMFLAYQEHSAYAAAQSDPTRATGVYLVGLAADAGIPTRPGEEQEDLRDRIFRLASLGTVTPTRIIEELNLIFDPISAQRCQVFETVLDRWYVSDGGAAWHSFVSDGTVDATACYPARHYDIRVQSRPGGAWAFSGRVGRAIIVRVPKLGAALRVHAAFAFDGTQGTGGLGLFVSDGTNLDGDANAFVFAGSRQTERVYQDALDMLLEAKGQGVRLMIVLDERL